MAQAAAAGSVSAQTEVSLEALRLIFDDLCAARHNLNAFLATLFYLMEHQ